MTCLALDGGDFVLITHLTHPAGKPELEEWWADLKWKEKLQGLMNELQTYALHKKP